MPLFTIYDDNGMPLERLDMPQSHFDAKEGSFNYIEGWLERGQYVKNGEIKTRPPQTDPQTKFNYATEQWEASRTDDECWAMVRGMRDELLVKSDWSQLPDVPSAIKTQYLAYRQELRDVTDQPGAPRNVVWPTPLDS